MRSWMAAFSLGIIVAGYIPWLPQVWLQAGLHYALLLPALASLQWFRLRLAGAFLCGLFWLLQWAHSTYEALLPAELEQRDIWVRGVVLDLPQTGDRSIRFLFRAEQWCASIRLADCDFETLAADPRRLQLNLYQEASLAPGQHWQLQVRLRRPHGFANPGGFDYEAWLWQQGINASGYVRAHPDNRLLAEGPAHSLNGLRHRFRQSLDDTQLANVGLIAALTIGDRDQVSRDDWALFAGTGTNHLMVISGLHVGFVALLCHKLAGLLWRQSACLCRTIPLGRSSALFAALAAFFYAGLAGFSLPAQRAAIMVAAFMLGQCLCRQTSVYNSFFLALGLVLLLDPLAPQNAGFWLSFTAVAVLIFAVSREPQAGNSVALAERGWQLLRVQSMVFIGLFPVMLLLFQQASLLSPLVNLFAIPYVSLLVVPLCLLALLSTWLLPPLTPLLLYLADSLLGWFRAALSAALLSWPAAVLQLPALSWWALLLLLAAVSLLLLAHGLPHAKKIRCLALLGALLILLPPRSAPADGEFEVIMLDVGQGLAVHVRTARHELLFDTGPAYSEAFNAGADIILPYLRARNIKNIDKLIISHEHADHAGGLSALAEAFPAALVYASAADSLSGLDEHELCRQGQAWHWDGIDFLFLHPDERYYGSNEASCVLRISNAQHSVLLTGDIERLAENRLLREMPELLAADILQAPHHGSRSSSSAPFMAAVSPQYVIYSAGYLNQFGHPHPEVVQGYTNSGTIALYTADSGAVSFRLGRAGELPEPERWRHRAARFWRDPGLKNVTPEQH